jgi:hypothetical protein
MHAASRFDLLHPRNALLVCLGTWLIIAATVLVLFWVVAEGHSWKTVSRRTRVRSRPPVSMHLPQRLLSQERSTTDAGIV